jgi:galactokinase
MTLASAAAALFAESFGTDPEGVWSAPGRVNLIGEHTDYTGGFVMPLAIDRRAAVAARRRDDRIVRAAATGRGVAEVSLDTVALGQPDGWLGYLAGAVRVAEQEGVSGHGWDLALVSDVPVGAGLSSSAAITCATLLALDDLDGWGRDRQTLALWAQQVEHRVIGTPCGIMDQTASMLCTAEHVLFLDTRSLDAVQVPWTAAAHGLTLLVTDTRAPHVLADGQYAERRRLCEEATALLEVPMLRDADLDLLDAALPRLSAEQAACARHVIGENARVLATRELLAAGRVGEIGPLLTASHASLRDDFRVTVPQLDVSVDAALEAGALGARMTGGGFGGCTIALTTLDAVGAVQDAIDREFAAQGWEAPSHLAVEPSPGAMRDA